MLIYLMRHGQTAFNREHRFQGQLDMPLDGEGCAQSEALAGRMKNITGVTRLYCSRQLRARTTAGLVGKAMGLIPEPLPGLEEFRVGRWAGQIADELRAGPEGALVGRFLAGDVEIVIPGGESVRQVQRRAAAALLPLLDEAEGDAAVVAHRVSLKALICAQADLPLEASRCFDNGNTGLTILRRTPGMPSKILTLNDTSHLAGGGRTAF
jgi:probable phosphoglycerate mutase